MTITMRDVARRCGVSVQTVSRILRGHADAYRGETVELVRAAARELGYRPPWMTVRPDETMPFLGVIGLGLGGPGTVKRSNGLCQAIEQAGYQVCLSTQSTNPTDDVGLVRIARSLKHQGAKGLFIYRGLPISAESRRALVELAIPVVFVDWGPPRWNARVILDRKVAAEQVASHLAGLGHRRVGFIVLAWAMDFLEHKILPFRRALSRHGVELVIEPNWIIPPHHDVEQLAYDAVREMVAGPTDVTALVAENDLIALAAMAAVRDAGRRVPDDLSVVGFDDLPAARFAVPPLTTIRGPGKEVGIIAMNMMSDLLRQPGQEVTQVTLPFELVVRGSTGPARHGERLISTRDPIHSES